MNFPSPCFNKVTALQTEETPENYANKTLSKFNTTFSVRESTLACVRRPNQTDYIYRFLVETNCFHKRVDSRSAQHQRTASATTARSRSVNLI